MAAVEITPGDVARGGESHGEGNEEEVGLVSGLTHDEERVQAEEAAADAEQGLMGLPRVVLLLFLLSSSFTLLVGLAIGVMLSPSLRPSLSSFLTLLPYPYSGPSPSSSSLLFPPEVPRVPTVPPSTPTSQGSGEISFLVVGDWGRDGAFNQSAVAKSMGRVASAAACSFVVSTGDNFYEGGLRDEADPLFFTSFSSIYSHPALLRLSWFSVLGNHDYVLNAAAQTGRGLRRRDPRWHCQQAYTLRLEPPCPTAPLAPPSPGEAPSPPDSMAEGCPPLLELFFLDTTPLLLSEWGPGGSHAGSRLNFSALLPDNVSFRETHLNILTQALAASDARWKAVVGHHPVRSVGTHGDTPDLIEHLLPILEAQGVDAYINGHDHCLQFIKRPDSPVYFVTSGAGSKAYREQRAAAPDEGLLFYYNGQGFVNAVVNRNKFSFNFRDVDGKMLFSHVIQK